jgi:hypothetical protein
MIHKTHAIKLSESGPANFCAIVACSWLVLGACGNGENPIELASKRVSNTCASGKNAIPPEPQDKAFWSSSRSTRPSPPACMKSYKY